MILTNKEKNERLAIQARKLNKPINPAMPVRVFISTTNKCNFKCPTCPNTIKKLKNKELPFQTFRDLAKELFPLAKEFHPTVKGEPLMTSYFDKIPSLLQKYKVHMNLTTNGMLLSKKTSKLIMPVLSDIKISFDGAQKSTFEKIRPGSNFRIVLNNIKELIKIRNNFLIKNKRKSKPTITLQTTLMATNIRELPDIVRIAANLGADRVKAYFMITYNQRFIKESLWFHKETTNYYLEKAKKLARNYKIITKFPKEFNLNKNIKTGTRMKNDHIVCHFLWQEAWVEEDGSIIPCCSFNAPILGNIYKTPFSKIWNNKSYQNLRRRINSNPPKYCQNCALVNEFNEKGKDYIYESLIYLKEN